MSRDKKAHPKHRWRAEAVGSSEISGEREHTQDAEEHGMQVELERWEACSHVLLRKGQAERTER